MLEEHGLPFVHIDGDKKLTNGKKLLQGYINAVQIGLVRAQ